MTYLDAILLIQERSEKVISDKPQSILTDKRLYRRKFDGDWEETDAPVVETDRFKPLPPPSPKEKKKPE